MALKVGNFSLDRLKISNLYSMYFGMSPREQTIALATAAATLLLVIILPIVMAGSRISKLERDVAQGRLQFKEIMHAIESYGEQKAKLVQMQQKLSGGYDSTLSSTVESIAEGVGIKDRIDELKPKQAEPSEIFDESSVSVRLKKLSLQQAIDFLFAIEHHSEKSLRIRQLSLKPRFDNKQEMDVSLTVSTFKLLEGAQEPS